MATRFIQAAIPTYKESYVDLPLEFINKQITQDQAGFDKGAAELAALSSLNQKMSAWAESQGYRDKLMNPYLTKLNDLSNQLYTTGQVGQVVPQIAKLNQQWTNDEQRLALEKDYQFYNDVYLPWTKQEGYSTAVDDYKRPDGSWNPEIDIKKSSSYARLLSDNEAAINKEVMKVMPSSYTWVTNQGFTPQYDATGQAYYIDPTTNTKKVLDYTVKDIENAANRISQTVLEQQGDSWEYYRRKHNLKDFSSARHFVDRFLEPRFFSDYDITPGNRHQISDGSGGSGGGGLGVEKTDDRFSITPFGYNETQYDYEGNNTQIYSIEKQQEELELQALSTFGTAVTQGKDTPKFKSTLNDLEIYTDQLLTQAAKDNPAMKKEYELLASSSSTFKEYILSNPVNAFKKGGIIEKNLGGEKKNQLKSMIYGKMLDIWKDPSSTEEAGYIEDYMVNYNQSKELDFQKDRLKSINNAIADEASKSYNFKGVGKEKGLETVNNYNEYADFYSSQGTRKSGNNTLGNLIFPASKEKELRNNPFYSGKLDNAVFIEDKKFNSWLDSGYLIKSVGGTPGDPTDHKNNPYYYGMLPQNTKGFTLVNDFNAHIKDKISKGKISINQNKIISETTDEEKNKGVMVHFQEDRVEEWKREPGKLKAIIMASDQGNSDAFNGKELYQIFQESTIKSKNFKPGADGDIEVTGVSFETDPRSSMPLMYITAKTKKKGEEGLTDEYSTISINLGKYDKNAAKDMMLQMITDNDDEVAAVGAQWFASLSADNSTLGAIGMFFDAGNDDIKEDNEITFSMGQGRLATNYVLRNVGNGKTQIGVYDENHNFKSFTGGTNSEGEFIDGNDIENYTDALQLIGFYQIGKVGVSNTENTNNQWRNDEESGGTPPEKGKWY